MKKNYRLYSAILLIAIAIIVAFQLLQPKVALANQAIRITALVGYVCVFGAILISAYPRQTARWFGHSFKAHHLFSITGLILVTLHPLAVAWQTRSLSVFIPAVDSLRRFLALGGRPSWYLLGLATLAAILRGAIGKNWRWLHALNYPAFWLATAHGLLIGSSVQNWPMRVVFSAMALIVLAILIQKHARNRQRKAGAGRAQQ